MNRWRVVVPCVVAATLCGCATLLTAEALRDLPTSEAYPGNPYVVMLDETIVAYEPGPGDGPPQRLTTRRWRARVLKPTVLPPLRADYSRTFTRVESLRAWTYDAKGVGKELDTSKRADLPVFQGSVLFSDDRAITVPLPPLAVGSIFESEIVTRDLDVRPFVTTETFGEYEPVKVARLVVSAPAAWELRWIADAPDDRKPTPTEATVDGRRVLTFERTDLPGNHREKNAPPLWMTMPRVTARLEKWTEGKAEKQAWETPELLSNWLSGEYATQAAVTPGLEQQVKEVLADVADDPNEKARALYEFACRSVQYCAIEIGYGGWIPHSAEDVRKGRYGDCKDKATYLHTLLKVAGISSAPTLIYAHDGTPRPFGLPSLGTNFNHAILAVDLPNGRTVYADPTHRAVPFGQLPPSDQEATVLELRSGGAQLRQTPASEAQVNVETQQLSLSLDASGDASGVVAIEARGAPALQVKNRILFGTGKLNEWLDKRVWTRGSHVADAKATRTGDFVDVVAVEGSLSLRHALIRGSSGDALLRVADLFEPWLAPIPENRRHDWVWPYAQTLRSTVTIKLPPGGVVGTLPPSAEVESAFGRYTLSWARRDDGLELTREFVRRKRVITKGEFRAANAFAREVLLAEHIAAVLKLPNGATP